MKITPLEIRQKTFEKKLRGLDKDEVNAFLLSLSNEWERMIDENKELKIKLEQSEKEVEKLREVESSLFKTLKTAEDTGANLVDQANKAAELHMKETQMASDALLSESKSKARAMIEKAEADARQIIEEMQEAVKDLEQNYRIVENNRDNIVTELKNLSADIIDRIERTNKQKKDFKMVDHLQKVKDLVRDSRERTEVEPSEIRTPKRVEVQREAKKVPVSKTINTGNIQTNVKKEIPKDKPSGDSKSFFDELE